MLGRESAVGIVTISNLVLRYGGKVKYIVGDIKKADGVVLPVVLTRNL